MTFFYTVLNVLPARASYNPSPVLSRNASKTDKHNCSQAGGQKQTKKQTTERTNHDSNRQQTRQHVTNYESKLVKISGFFSDDRRTHTQTNLTNKLVNRRVTKNRLNRRLIKRDGRLNGDGSFKTLWILNANTNMHKPNLNLYSLITPMALCCASKTL